MPTYPLTFPSIPVVNARFALTRASGQSISPFTLKKQVVLHQGEQWSGNINFRPVLQADAAEIQAFLMDLQGQFGTFLYGDPNYLAQGARGVASGSPLVNGAGQTGNTLNIDNLGNNITGWLLKGDYFQRGSGLTARLHMLTEDADTNGAGETTLTFFPNIRTASADNEAVVIASPMGLMRSASNVAGWDVSTSNIYAFPFGFESEV